MGVGFRILSYFVFEFGVFGPINFGNLQQEFMKLELSVFKNNIAVYY
jgi:hypothetical protein